MPATTISLRTADGYGLTASHFEAAGDQYIVMAGATGVPRGFYRRFAKFAQQRRINVITTDYRGIGDSKPATLRGFDMQYADWSRYDLAAAIDYAAHRGQVFVVGHSLGGHAIGQLPRPDLVQAAYTCGTGAGWSGWMPGAERIRVWTLWHVLGPMLTTILGYQPMSKLGLGEDLPLGVYRDWKKWCAFPHYFFDDVSAKNLTDGFAQVRLPIAAAVATDDLWAPPASRNAFFKGYPNAPIEYIDIQPAQCGVTNVGHMGYFRANVGEQLWPNILSWLQGHGLQVTPPVADNTPVSCDTMKRQ
jgi:predicted alpha/beta hydrolase